MLFHWGYDVTLKCCGILGTGTSPLSTGSTVRLGGNTVRLTVPETRYSGEIGLMIVFVVRLCTLNCIDLFLFSGIL